MTLILLSLVLLLSGAGVSAMLTRRPRAGLLTAVLAVSGASALCLAAGVMHLASDGAAAISTLDWPMPLGRAHVELDGLSAWFLVCVSLLSLAVAPYAWSYMPSDARESRAGAFGALLCLLLAALVILLIAADAVLFLAGWEAMTLAAFFLVSFHHVHAEVRRGGWMYLIATHLGTALCVVPLFALLAARSGGLSFAEFRAAGASTGGGNTLLFLLALVGFGTKAGFMPMHVWLPVAHPAAPTPVSALLSGVVIKTGIYGLLRVLGWLPALPRGCGIFMLAFAMVSGVLGVLYALAQHDLKRLLAYHSVENIGIIGLGVGMGMLGTTHGQPVLTALGYGGALLHVLNHALFKGLLFLSAGAVIHGAGTADIERLGGLARRTPMNAALFLIGALSICGLPPFNGFVSEWLVYGSLFGGASGRPMLSAATAALAVVALALMGGLALACFAKAFAAVFLGEPRDPLIRAHATPLSMRAGMALLAVLCAAIGLLPSQVLPLLAGSVSAITKLEPVTFQSSMHGVLAPAGRLSVMALVFVGVAALLARARRVMLRPREDRMARSACTWGCGFAQATARMQYTASSFAWSLIRSFRNALWPCRRITAPMGAFPAAAQLESHTPDMAEHDLFAPVFRGAAELFRRCRTVSWSRQSAEPPGRPEGASARPMRLLLHALAVGLRRGRIHVCLAFIGLTLLVVLCVDSLLPAGSAAPRGGTRPVPAMSGDTP